MAFSLERQTHVPSFRHGRPYTPRHPARLRPQSVRSRPARRAGRSPARQGLRRYLDAGGEQRLGRCAGQQSQPQSVLAAARQYACHRSERCRRLRRRGRFSRLAGGDDRRAVPPHHCADVDAALHDPELCHGTCLGIVVPQFPRRRTDRLYRRPRHAGARLARLGSGADPDRAHRPLLFSGLYGHCGGSGHGEFRPRRGGTDDRRQSQPHLFRHRAAGGAAGSGRGAVPGLWRLRAGRQRTQPASTTS